MPQPTSSWICRTTPDGYQFLAKPGDYRRALVKTPDGACYQLNQYSVVEGPLPFKPFLFPGWVEVTFAPPAVRDAIQQQALDCGAVIADFRAAAFRFDLRGLFADASLITPLAEVPLEYNS